MDYRSITRSFDNLLKILEERKKCKNIKLEYIVYNRSLKETEDIETIKSDTRLVLKSVSGKDIPDTIISCIWTPGIKLGANIQDIIVANKDIKHFILLIETVITSDCKKTIINLEKIGYTIEIFYIKELQYNIFDSMMIPSYRLVEKAERDSVLEMYGIKPGNMIKINNTDPIARYLGLVKNDVVYITRDSDTMIGKKVLEYKIVV